MKAYCRGCPFFLYYKIYLQNSFPFTVEPGSGGGYDDHIEAVIRKIHVKDVPVDIFNVGSIVDCPDSSAHFIREVSCDHILCPLQQQQRQPPCRSRYQGICSASREPIVKGIENSNYCDSTLARQSASSGSHFNINNKRFRS
jgi:hypothetical protein